MSTPIEAFRAARIEAKRLGIPVLDDRIQMAFQRAILGTEDEPCGILDRYQLNAVEHEGKTLIHIYCQRCHHVQIVARDMDGDQKGVTLAEWTESALRHEEEAHP
jgi:hypothetical protein